MNGKFHHLIDRIGAMSDAEKRLMVQYSDATGFSIQDLIALSWRHYAVANGDEIRRALDSQAVIERITA